MMFRIRTLLMCYVAVSISLMNMVQSLERTSKYERSDDLDGLTCLVTDVVLEEECKSRIKCLTMCMGQPCETIFYNTDTMMCTGCYTRYSDGTGLPASPGTMAYKSPFEPEDCKDVYDVGNDDSGAYRIYPVGHTKGIQVRCDMDTPPGGWTIIQRRIDATDFYKTWSEYKDGFGDVSGSYWLGNDLIWQLTSNKDYLLRIDLTAQDGMTGYAEYDYFSIEDESLLYSLNVGGFSGDVGDSFTYHDQSNFSTYDKDNDAHSTNCAATYHGAWWYKECLYSNLNGDYMNEDFGQGLNWFAWRGLAESMLGTEMKILPAHIYIAYPLYPVYNMGIGY